ncbi:hypothetical protein PILCRDRAFT_815979 [Piloderma croceum F 1598]|uniref:GPI transamidase component PIG-S n=1 Tax=Piloderma croceum (strain F 1598) TaxID=765440 RepID=A0A0C3BK42_PILCF|nr:hypothetical protein PILCRDRAFT_815979 [Piloderma croceum F 1598]
MSSPQWPSSLKDPSKICFESTQTRRLVLGSYWAVVLLALPLWWYTTSIERLSLPSSRVLGLFERDLRFQLHLQLNTEGYKDAAVVARDWQGILDQRTALGGRWEGLDVYVHPKKHGDFSDVFGTYTVNMGPYKSSAQDRQLSLTTANVLTDDSPTTLIDTLSDLLAPYAPSDSHDCVVQYAPRYRLAFTMLNEDAAAGQAVHGWDIQDAIAQHISPHLLRLSVLHNFTIESQVQFHAPLAFKPIPISVDGRAAHGLMPEDLTVFVNSAQWTLSSSVSNDPVLHFILYVPSVTQRPLYILNADGTTSRSTAFLLPQWGGIVLFNPPPPSDLHQHTHLSSHSLMPIMNSFSTQLLALLGVPPLPPAVRCTQSNSSLTDWQLDALLRRRILENVDKSTKTLGSIVQLVDQIENMPVGPDVRGDVQDALIALDKVFVSSRNSTIETLLHSSQALSLASRAFFNPGMLALLYFPAEHKYAVYTPLFASVAVPLLAAVGRELIAWRRSRKQRAESKGGEQDRRERNG